MKDDAGSWSFPLRMERRESFRTMRTWSLPFTVGIGRMEAEEGKWQEVALGGGFAEIVNNRVTLIVDTAERPEDIDVRRAREQRERAEEQLRQKQSTQEYYHTQASLARAMNRLRLAQDKKWNL